MTTRTIMSDEALAQLGRPSLVYIRPIRVADLASEVADMPDLPGDTILYSVHAADGTRMAVLDNRDAAIWAARQYEMEPVSVH